MLFGEVDVEAYAEAHRKEYETSGDAMAQKWNRIALAVAPKTGKRVGLDTSTRMARNAVFAPDREPADALEPRPSWELCQVDVLKNTQDLNLQPFRVQSTSTANRGRSILTEVEVQASGAAAAIVAAANIAWPPRTFFASHEGGALKLHAECQAPSAPRCGRSTSNSDPIRRFSTVQPAIRCSTPPL